MPFYPYNPASQPVYRLAAFLLAACVGCGEADSTASANADRLSIVATTGPVGVAVRRIAGDRAEGRVMMGPGVDPHLYRALPSDLVALDEADIVVFNGLHLEGRLADVLERLARRKKVIEVAGALAANEDPRLLTPPEFAGQHDPHVWHDVEGAETYAKNFEDYRAELLRLDAECRERMATVPAGRRVLVTAHDAFAYFSRAYGLESVGLKGISTEDQVDLGRMAEVVELIVERDVPCVFVESAVAPRVVGALVEPCRERGHELKVVGDEDGGPKLYADALGSAQSGAGTYVGMIRANVDTIVTGLTGGEASEAGEPAQSEAAAP